MFAAPRVSSAGGEGAQFQVMPVAEQSIYSTPELHDVT